MEAENKILELIKKYCFSHGVKYGIICEFLFASGGLNAINKVLYEIEPEDDEKVTLH